MQVERRVTYPRIMSNVKADLVNQLKLQLCTFHTCQKKIGYQVISSPMFGLASDT